MRSQNLHKYEENNIQTDNQEYTPSEEAPLYPTEISFQTQDKTIIRCSVNGPLHCQQCESCRLQEKSVSAKTWFTSLSFNNQRVFLQQLIFLSDDIAEKLGSVLSSLVSKDFHYSSSKLKYESFGNDLEIDFTNHSLDISKMEELINDEYLSWYAQSTEWTKHNFLFGLLKLCSAKLIKLVNDLLTEKVQGVDQATHFTSSPRCITEESSMTLPAQISTNSHAERAARCKSAPARRPISAMRSPPKAGWRRLMSAKERSVTFKTDVQQVERVTDEVLGSSPSRHSRPASSLSKTSFAQNVTQSVSRCTPLQNVSDLPEIDDEEDDNLTISASLTFSECPQRTIDFIRQLPVQISKKIFGFLSESELFGVRLVSTHWYFLAEQTKKEFILNQIASEDVMMMQATGAKVPNPVYARNVPIHIAKVDRYGYPIINIEAKHVDIETLVNELTDLDMETCYDGFETRKCMMEERNVLCSSYNVFVVTKKKDIHRKIHFTNGRTLVSGSFDRKVLVYDINSGKLTRTIKGHTGSVKCVFVLEKKGLIISAGYDTSARIWSLRTGKCLRLLRGHRKTVIALSANDKYIASSATDQTTRIWLTDTGQCKLIIPGKSVVRVVRLKGYLLITGNDAGVFTVWDIEENKVLKKMSDHKAAITCVRMLDNHYLSGSLDTYVILWSRVETFMKPLVTYRHPQAVLCMEVLYCRIITGCLDGKVRVWNMLNGDCLRVIRGNSKNDAITHLFANEYRLVVNTLNCVLVYYFVKKDWDYTAPRNTNESYRPCVAHVNERPLHSQSRALKVQCVGSPIHRQQSAPPLRCPSPDDFRSNELRRLESRSCSSIGHHISRMRKTMSQPYISNISFVDDIKSSVTCHTNRTNIHSRIELQRNESPPPFVKDVMPMRKEINENHKEIERDLSRNKFKSRAKCRSAPANRLQQLPRNERGLTSSASQKTNITENRIVLPVKTKPLRKISTPSKRVIGKHKPVGENELADLKIKTFTFQLKDEYDRSVITRR